MAAADGLAVLPDGDGVAGGRNGRGRSCSIRERAGGPTGVRAPYDGPVADLVDSFGRVHRDLRISVTDRCNFRCSYCMPEEGMDWLPRDEVLTFEEIERIARAHGASATASTPSA